MPNTDGSSNVYLTDDLILKEALRLLENDLVALRMVNRAAESKFGGSYKNGDSVSVKKPYRVKAAEGRILQVAPMVDQSVTMTVDRQTHVGLQFTQTDRTLSLNEFSDRYLKSAIAQIAHKVDFAVLQEMRRSFFNQAGVPGNAFTYEVGLDARAKATKLGVPKDGMMNFLLDTLDAANYRKGIAKLANEDMMKAAIERAYLGDISQTPAFETAQMPIHTVGNYTGTPLVNGASQSGSTLVTDGWGNNIATLLNVGDIFTIGGVFSVNPQTYESTGFLQQFVVTAVASSNGSGQSTVSISPAINPGTLTALDGDGNTVSLAAYQNVTAAPADDAPITVLGAAGSTRRENFLAHKDAVSVAIVDLEAPEAAMVAKRARHDKSGLSLLMTAGYNVNDFTQIYRLDVLYGIKAWYPELGMRVHGAA